MACIDTTILLDLLGRGGKRRFQRARAFVASLLAADEDLTTTRFNVAELYIGIARSDSAVTEESKVSKLLRGFRVLEFDDRGARAFGKVAAHLQSIGRPSGDMDALIAAVAITNAQPLATQNVKHFQDMPGLVLLTYQ